MRRNLLMTIIASAIIIAALFVEQSAMYSPVNILRTDTIPHITPDYDSLIIPQNIAPLNFTVSESGDRYIINIHDADSQSIIIKSKTPEIHIPQKKWAKLLYRNAGKTIEIDITMRKSDRQWVSFAPVCNRVAKEKIDGYLVYRLIPPVYTSYGKMGIYQRELSTFNEKTIIQNGMTGDNCMNCHTFKNNDPDYMVMHMRGGTCNGTFIKQKDNIFKVNTATEITKPGGNPAWHPSGSCIAFSIDKIRQFFHATGNNKEGIDRSSDIVLYTFATNVISSTPELASPEYMETQPEWSPDGRYLYFCRADQFQFDSTPNCQEKIVFDLMRIEYSVEKNTWGKAEPVLTHATTGQSIRQQKISPDGRFLLFSMAPYGSFNTYRPGSDIYILNLISGEYCKLDVNSDRAESFPGWSSNGRWIVFSSKRTNGLCARPYFCYFDAEGNTSKPFILPQKNPKFYDSFLKTYNLPSFIKSPIGISPHRIAEIMEDNKNIRNAKIDPAMKKWKKNQNTYNTQETWVASKR